MTLNFKTKKVVLLENRIAKLAAFIRSNDFRSTTNYTVWASLIGKLVAYAMLNRRILSHFDKLYSHTPQVFKKHVAKSANVRFKITEQQHSEVKGIISLLPLAQVKIDLPISTYLIAFDASRIAAAVFYTHLHPDEA